MGRETKEYSMADSSPYLKVLGKLDKKYPDIFFGMGRIQFELTGRERIEDGKEDANAHTILDAYASVGLLERTFVVGSSCTGINEPSCGWRITLRGKGLLEEISS